jgi:hypothetical protein
MSTLAGNGTCSSRKWCSFSGERLEVVEHEQRVQRAARLHEGVAQLRPPELLDGHRRVVGSQHEAQHVLERDQVLAHGLGPAGRQVHVPPAHPRQEPEARRSGRVGHDAAAHDVGRVRLAAAAAAVEGDEPVLVVERQLVKRPLQLRPRHVPAAQLGQVVRHDDPRPRAQHWRGAGLRRRQLDEPVARHEVPRAARHVALQVVDVLELPRALSHRVVEEEQRARRLHVRHQRHERDLPARRRQDHVAGLQRLHLDGQLLFLDGRAEAEEEPVVGAHRAHERQRRRNGREQVRERLLDELAQHRVEHRVQARRRRPMPLHLVAQVRKEREHVPPPHRPALGDADALDAQLAHEQLVGLPVQLVDTVRVRRRGGDPLRERALRQPPHDLEHLAPALRAPGDRLGEDLLRRLAPVAVHGLREQADTRQLQQRLRRDGQPQVRVRRPGVQSFVRSREELPREVLEGHGCGES